MDIADFINYFFMLLREKSFGYDCDYENNLRLMVSSQDSIAESCVS